MEMLVISVADKAVDLIEHHRWAIAEKFREGGGNAPSQDIFLDSLDEDRDITGTKYICVDFKGVSLSQPKRSVALLLCRALKYQAISAR